MTSLGTPWASKSKRLKNSLREEMLEGGRRASGGSEMVTEEGVKWLPMALWFTRSTQNHQTPCFWYLKTRFFGGENPFVFHGFGCPRYGLRTFVNLRSCNRTLEKSKEKNGC